MKPITFSRMSRWIEDHISFYFPCYVDSCYLSAPELYGLPSSSKAITLTMPLPITVLSLLLLWTFLCFGKIPHKQQCRNTNPRIFELNKIRESNLFWHFLISEAMNSSCQWKTIITTHTKIIAFTFNVNSLAPLLNAQWELQNTGI